jgi:hypothetical protein
VRIFIDPAFSGSSPISSFLSSAVATANDVRSVEDKDAARKGFGHRIGSDPGQ